MHPTPRSFTLTALAAFALLAVALPSSPAAVPFEINPDRVTVTRFGGSLAGSKTYFIPTVTLRISADGSIWSQSKSGGANAQAHALFHVKGLDKALVQGLARRAQDDLVAKLRAAGYTVLTFEDLKSHPEIAGHGRLAADAKWNLPTSSKDSLTYLIVNPSDDQALDRPINGPVWWLRNVAKEKDLIVMVPEITLNVPTVYGEASGGYKRAEANVVVKPAMRLHGATIWTTNAKGGSANIEVKEHGQRLVTEVAGTAKKLTQDDTEFSSSWQRTSVNYLFTLDQAAFSDGVTRVTSVINDLIVAQIAKAKK